MAKQDEPIHTFGQDQGMPARQIGLVTDSLHLQPAFLKETDLIALVPETLARQTSDGSRLVLRDGPFPCQNWASGQSGTSGTQDPPYTAGLEPNWADNVCEWIAWWLAWPNRIQGHKPLFAGPSINGGNGTLTVFGLLVENDWLVPLTGPSAGFIARRCSEGQQ